MPLSISTNSPQTPTPRTPNQPSGTPSGTPGTPMDSQSPSTPFDDFYVQMSDLSLGDKIGAGRFGSVNVGKYFGDIVAIKIQHRSKPSLEGYLLRELSVLKGCRHESCLEYLGACDEVTSKKGANGEIVHTHTLYIVTEFAANGDLHNLITSHPQHLNLGYKFLSKILLGIADALTYLHKTGIIHRDIKSENILLDSNWNPKVSDFGTAREIPGITSLPLTAAQSAQKHEMTICGTTAYMAPELMFDEIYNFSADVFSFGIVIFEMLGKQIAGTSTNGDKVSERGFCSREGRSNFKLDYNAIKDKLSNDAPESLIELALVCTDYEPSDRPLTTEIVGWIEDNVRGMDEDKNEPPKSKEIPVVDEARMRRLSLNEKEFDEGISYDKVKNKTGGKKADNEEEEISDLTRKLNENNMLVTSRPNSPNSAQIIKKTSPKATTPAKVITNTRLLLHQSSSNLPLPAVTKMGWLYKRNRFGFRNWKKRWFVLKPSESGNTNELSWYVSHRDVFFGNTWGKPNGKIDLKNNVLIRGGGANSAWRFQLLNFDDMSKVNDTKIHNREVAALSEKEMESWLVALEEHIDEANGGGSNSIRTLHQLTDAETASGNAKVGASGSPIVERASPHSSNSNLQDLASIEELQGGEGGRERRTTMGATAAARRKSNNVFDEEPLTPGESQTKVNRWLKTLGLSAYVKNFNDNMPLLTMRTLDHVGLSDADLDSLKIKEDNIRRLLKHSVKCGYVDELEVSVTGSRDFGDVVVFRVSSHFNIRRSIVYLRFNDFVKLLTKLKIALQRRLDLRALLPSLPGKGIWEQWGKGNFSNVIGLVSDGRIDSSKSERKFIEDRRKELDSWIKVVVGVCLQDVGGKSVDVLIQCLELSVVEW